MTAEAEEVSAAAEIVGKIKLDKQKQGARPVFVFIFLYILPILQEKVWINLFALLSLLF